MTAEEHNYLGGLGESVARTLTASHPVPQEMVDTQDTFGESGTPKELMSKYGIDKGAIIQKVKSVLKRK